MSYLNLNNVCQFEGRLIADPELGTPIQGKNGPITKVRFKLAIDKNMDKTAKAAAVAAGKPTADFPTFEVIGPKADFVNNWLKKGKPCKVLATFRNYDYMDNTVNPPVKKFGYSFDVVDVTFTVSDSGAGTGAPGGNGAANNTGNQPPQDNSYAPINDADMPF